MALKKRCIGCGYQVEFIAGEMFICPYCGTEQNPGLSVDHTDVLRNALKRKAHITAQAITGTKPYTAIRIALPSTNDCQIRMCIIIKTVNTSVTVKEMMNL